MCGIELSHRTNQWMEGAPLWRSRGFAVSTTLPGEPGGQTVALGEIDETWYRDEGYGWERQKALHGEGTSTSPAPHYLPTHLSSMPLHLSRV